MKDTSPLVSIVIVNWNGKNWLKGCLSSLTRVTYKSIEWIIVDNASTDGSAVWIKQNFPNAILITNRENLGFSHANNIGYKRSKGEFILFLNNDTKVKPDFITELLKPFSVDESIGGVQSKILLMDNHSRLDSIGAFLTPTGFLFHNHLGEKDKVILDHQVSLYTAKGACMMFRKEVLRKVEVDGLIFDPWYFAYFEESDLCHRVWLSGYRIIYVPKSVIFHKLGATSVKLVSAHVQYNSYKNRINSYIKNLGSANLWYILPIHVVTCQMLAAVFLIKGNPSWAIAIERAIWWNIRNFVRTIKYRHIVQTKIRKLQDYEFFDKIMKFPPVSYYTGFLDRFLQIYTH